MKPNRKNPYFNTLFLSNCLAAALVVSLTLQPNAHAANENRYWDGGTANIGTDGDGASLGTVGNWNTTLTNWDAGAVAHVAWVNANNDFANFAGTAGTVTLTSAVSANRLIFGSTGYILGGVSANTLTLAGPATEISAGTGFTATINSIVAGTGGFIKSGQGKVILAPASTAPPTVTLTGNNSITGAISVTGGELQGTVPTTAGTYTPFGTGSITLSSGTTLRVFTGSTGNALTVANAINLNGSTLAHEDGNFALSGAVALSGSNNIIGRWSGKNLTLSGAVTGTGSINKNDVQSGITLSLTNAGNTFSGGFTLTTGNVSISSGTGLGTGALNIGSAATVFTASVGTLVVANTAATTVANNIVLPAPGVATQYGIMKSAASTTTGTQLNLTGVISGGGANTTLVLNSNTGSDVTTTYRMAGTNTFTGKVQIYRGGLVVTNTASLGLGTNILELNSNNSALGDLRFENAITLSNPVSLMSAATISSNGVSAGLSGIISGSASLNKVGAGTLTLSGANTATGTNTVTAGTLSLDYGTQDNSKLADAASLTLAGGTTLNLTSASATTHMEVVASTSITGNVSITRSGSSANKIALGAITNSGGSLTLGGDNIATTTVALTNGLLPAFITVNGALATKDGSDNIVAYTGYADVNRLGGAIADGAGSNVRIIEAGSSGDVTLAAAGTTTIGTLYNAGTVAPTLVDIGSGNTLRLNDLGTILAGTNGLAITGGTLTAGGIADTAGTVDIFNGSATATTVSSAIANNGAGVVGLTKSGTGVLVLSGTNTYTGASTINGGILALSGGSAIADTGTISLSNSAGVVLRLDSSETIGTVAATGTASSINLQANALTLGDGSNFTISSPITGTGGSLVKQGAGTLTLTGVNTYTGGTTLSLGALTATISTTQNSLGTGAASIATGTTLTLNNTNVSDTTPAIANIFTGTGILKLQFAANTTARNTTLSGVAGFNGTIQLSNLGSNGDKWNLASSGVLPAAVIIDSGSQLFPVGGATTFSGGITVSGTGNSENRGAIRNINTILGGNITLAGGTTFGPEGTATFTGNITSSALAPVLLTVGTANSTGNTVFSGAIGDGASSVVSVTKATGTSTMTLSGVNTYTGATAINAGTLNLTGSVASSAVTLAAGTTLSGEGAVASLTTSGASNLIINPASGGALTASGALTLGGTATVSFAGGAPPLSGSIVVMNFGSTTAVPANFALAGAGSYRNPQFVVNATNVELTLGNTSLTWTGTGGTNWDVNTTSNWNDTAPAASKFLFGDAVTFDDGPGANQTVGLTVNVQPSSITVNNSTYSYSIAGAGSITGFAGITKSGTNSLSLGGTGNTYTGAVAVNGGVLTTTSATALGQTSGVTIATGARVDLNGQLLGSTGALNTTWTIAGDGGDGAGGLGAISNSGADVFQNSSIFNLVLSGNAEVGSNNGRFDIGRHGVSGVGGSINGNGNTFTKVGSNFIVMRAPATNITYVVNAGRLSFEDYDTSSGTNDIVVSNTGSAVGSYGVRTIPNNVTLNAGTQLVSIAGGGTGTWSGAITLASNSTLESQDGLILSGTATLSAGGILNKTGTNQLTVTGSLIGSGGTLNQNAGTIQIGNVGATGSFTGFPTVNLGNGVLFRNRLTTVSNTISSNFTFANASAEVRQHGVLTTDTLTLTGTIGTNTANGILRSTFGKLVLGSGASSIVNRVAAQGAPASGRGVIEVQTGASLTSPWFDIGQDDSNSGILNVTGGTVTALTGGAGGNNALRIGHWNNNSATIPSELNVSDGTLDASATNLTTCIGWDGYGIMTVGGGANPAVAKVYGILLDANGDSPTYNDTATLLSNGTLEVGLGGTVGASANDYIILNGGTIKGVAASTWAAKMDVTAATTSFASVNTGITVTQTGTLTGTGTLEKTGPGLLQATGGAFAGTLTSSGGTLHFGTTAWTAATVTSTAGGVIQPGTSNTAGASTIPTLTLNGGSPTFRANYNLGNFGDRFVVTGSNAFTVAAPTALTVIPGIDLFVGDKIPLIDYSGTIGGASGLAGLSVTAAGNPHYALSLEDDTVNTIVKVSIDGLDSVTWKGNIDGNWDVDTTSNWQTDSDSITSKFYNLDAVKFTDDGAATSAVTLVGTIQPSSVRFDSSFDYTLSGTPIIGSGTFVKSNLGKVTLLNNNTYTGTTTINSGTVAVGNGGATGALGGSGDIVLATSDAVIEFNRSDAQTLSRRLTGSGRMVKNGAGTLTMSGAPSAITGTLQIDGGTVVLATTNYARALGNSAGIIVNTGTLRIASTNVLYDSSDIPITANANTNIEIQTGAGGHNHFVRLNLNGATVTGIGTGMYANEYSTFDGLVTVGGTQQSTVTRAVGGTGAYYLNGGSFNVGDVTSGTDLLFNAPLTGQALTKTGAGTMTLSEVNTYTGGTNANGGILEVSSVADAGGAGSIGVYTAGSPGYLGIANDGTFRYTGTGSQTTARNLWIDTGAQNKTIEVTSATGAITFSGTGGNIDKPFTKTGAGALTLADVINVGATVTVNGGRLSLTGANTYTGDTTVLAGTLAVNGTAIANTNKLIIDGGKVEPTGTEVVDTLYFGGVQQIAGTWGATGSGAANIDDVHFAGIAGVISVTTGPAGYVSWAALKGLTGASGFENGTADDPDKDGINNLQEFYFDGDPLANNQAILPQLSSDATYIYLTFKRRDDSETDIISQNAQWGSDLIGWTPATITAASAAADANGVIINVAENGTAPDDVTVSIPRANAIGFRLFGRVVIVK